MSTVRLVLGAEVRCTDGSCGALTRVLLDARSKALTYLVVERRLRHRQSHLVPIALATALAPEILLSCSREAYERLDSADELQFLLAPGGSTGYSPNQAAALPYYGGPGMSPVEGRDRLGGVGPLGERTDGPVAMSYDHVPRGQCEIARGSTLACIDGPVGTIVGLEVDVATSLVSGLAVRHRHLTGARDITVAIGRIHLDPSNLRVDLTRDELDRLPGGEP